MLDNINPVYKSKYAFVGVGKHSLSTFYPILSYLNTPIKYIVTQRSDFGNQIVNKFPQAKAVKSYDEILADQEVRGIFISAAPKSHFDLTRKALENHKHVFVEKPVCHSSEQLKQLISVGNTLCMVGLQKRYGVLNALVKKKYPRPMYYSAHYAVGSYPEGSPVYELFIHPIDNTIFLFGRATISFIRKIVNHNSVTILLHLEHDSGVQGTLELSTCHNWDDPIDFLRLEMPSETVHIDYPSYLSTTSKEKCFYGLPLNKAFRLPLKKKVIYQNTGKIASLETNPLFEAGYFNEIKEFINFVENPGTAQLATSSIDQLLDTHQLLDIIQNY